MSSNAPTGDRILGSLRSADGKGIVRMEDRFDTDIDDLWSALTDPGRLARWIGEVEGDLRLGGEFRTHFFASGSQSTGRVEACEPPQRLLLRTKHVDKPWTLAIEATLTCSMAMEPGSRSISNTSPTTWPGVSPARSKKTTSRCAGTNSSLPTNIWRPTSTRRTADALRRQTTNLNPPLLTEATANGTASPAPAMLL
jgi:uncharacterized protein YndB with AHSA1/START domain